MTRKIIVSIIAIVLIVGVIGGCFALYYTKGADKTVSITTEYEQITMSIKNGANTGDQGTITIDAISPEEGHAIKTVDITLTAAPSSLFDGIHGLFTVSLTGDLATYIEASADLLDGAEGDPIAVGSNITTAVFGSGYDTALTDTPVFVRLTFSLSAAAIADFSLAAEKQATLTITWEPVTASVWSYDDNAYYVVGTLGGANKWDVNYTNQNPMLTATGITPVVAEETIIATITTAFGPGDSIKVMKGNSIWVNSWTSYTDDFYNSDGQIYFNNGGTYKVDVKHTDQNGGYDYFVIARVD